MKTSEALKKIKDRRDIAVLLVGFIVVLAQWYRGVFLAPNDAGQGEVYRIIYLHVPAAFCAFLCAFDLLISSIRTLVRPNEIVPIRGQATAEIGLMATILTLMTGMIWGKPVWGVYWTWDVRLTTTFILALMYAGYLLLKSSMAPGSARDKACAVLGILIAVDVPIIYKSVTWWNTLHQPQTILRPDGKSTMDPDMLRYLLLSIAAMLIFVMMLIDYRKKNLILKLELERRMMAGVS